MQLHCCTGLGHFSSCRVVAVPESTSSWLLAPAGGALSGADPAPVLGALVAPEVKPELRAPSLAQITISGVMMGETSGAFTVR